MVKLIWITPEAEALIANIARVSNPANQDNPEFSGLISYMHQASSLVAVRDGQRMRRDQHDP